MGSIIIDFVIDGTESNAGNLPAINFFCDDFIVKGYQKLSPFYDVRYGITVFYGKDDNKKVYLFKNQLLIGDRYRFNRTFDTIETGNGSEDGKDDIIGGIRYSSEKLKDVDADLKIMIVFSDSYVERISMEESGIISAQKLYLFLAEQSELGDVNMNLFWGMPMRNRDHKVDHQLTPRKYDLADIFDLQQRELRINEIIDSILESMD